MIKILESVYLPIAADTEQHRRIRRRSFEAHSKCSDSQRKVVLRIYIVVGRVVGHDDEMKSM